VKLCRFELKSSPGEIRSGLVYSGKIYETDGEQSIAVHEAEAVRPLSPVGRPPSIRIFRMSDGLLPTTADDGVPLYFHANPTGLYGPSQLIPRPSSVARLDFEPYLVGIVGSDGLQVPVESGDAFILGYTLALLLVSHDHLREEAELHSGYGRSFDIGGVIGPVITTPDDLDEVVTEEVPARKYGLSVVTRLNGVENGRGEIGDLPASFAQLVAASSDNGPVRSGDLIAIGPISSGDEANFLEPGDDVQVSVEHLGTLSLKIS
jgi:2-keto-4-pentenoate hydratase/2-oxohepta-3-ene-1,7-dioic acid hydratase in catechol pathway